MEMQRSIFLKKYLVTNVKQAAWKRLQVAKNSIYGVKISAYQSVFLLRSASTLLNSFISEVNMAQVTVQTYVTDPYLFVILFPLPPTWVVPF